MSNPDDDDLTPQEKRFFTVIGFILGMWLVLNYLYRAGYIG